MDITHNLGGVLNITSLYPELLLRESQTTPAAPSLARKENACRDPGDRLGGLLLHGCFEADARLKLWNIARLDLNGLAGMRISAHARCPVRDAEGAETRQLHLLSLFERPGHGTDDSV